MNYLNQKDFSGQHSGHLVALFPYVESESNHSSLMWICQCDCGRRTLISPPVLNLKNPNLSCGCGRISKLKEELNRINKDRYSREKKVESFFHEKGIRLSPPRDETYLEQLLIEDIRRAANEKCPFTIGGNFYGLWSRRKEMPQPLQAIGRNRLESMARDLVEQHKIVKCLTGSSKKVKKFLDVPTGIWAVGTDLYLIENKYLNYALNTDR